MNVGLNVPLSKQVNKYAITDTQVSFYIKSLGLHIVVLKVLLDNEICHSLPYTHELSFPI